MAARLAPLGRVIARILTLKPLLLFFCKVFVHDEPLNQESSRFTPGGSEVSTNCLGSEHRREPPRASRPSPNSDAYEYIMRMKRRERARGGDIAR